MHKKSKEKKKSPGKKKALLSKSYIDLDLKTTRAEKTRLIKQKNALWNIEKKILGSYLSKYKQPVIWDIGSGLGLYSMFFDEVYGKNYVYYGIDKNKDFLKFANKKFSKSNHFFFQGDILRDPLNLPKPDIIFLRLILMHLTPKDILALLKKCKKYLNRNGQIIIFDTDDSYFQLYPEPEFFDCLKYVKARSQKSLGGDRFVGRKIYSYLKKSEYKNISVNPYIFTSEEIGKKQFADFIFPIFKLQMDSSLISEKNLVYGMSKLNQWVGNNDSFATAIEYLYIAKK